MREVDVEKSGRRGEGGRGGEEDVTRGVDEIGSEGREGVKERKKWAR